MFKCGQCDKVYKTRTSLTRHTHNHATVTGQHTCHNCGVVFARRDILNRHVNNGHCAVPSASRRRCHTACEGCRAARIRCNGEDPCHACDVNGRTCQYPLRTGRISQAPRPVPRHLDSADSEQTRMDQTDRESSLHLSIGSVTPTDSPHSSLPNIDTKGTISSQPRTHHGAGEVKGIPHVPWPWLHENLFMENTSQADPRFRPPRPMGPGQDDPPGSYTPNSAHPMISPLTTVVENLVAYAANTAFTPDEKLTRRRYWQTASFQLSDIFHESGIRSTEPPQETLHGLVRTHLARFNPLWPLLDHEQQDPDVLHPVLFLTVSSIGAMFGSNLHRQYGTLMHQRLRRLLSASLYDLEGPDDGLIWLAQARTLTQVASLYFGQRQSFSYAQHLSAILVAQLRRMDCFREIISSHDRLHAPIPNLQADNASWHTSEIRRRLAYGVLRTDIFTSILLGTRPLLTYEEVNMTLPRSDALWLNVENLDLSGLVAAQRIEDTTMSKIPFSDLVRIFLDRNETKPQLSPIGYELCLFGLQGAVWSFSQDPELFSRVTPNLQMSTDLELHENTSERVPLPDRETRVRHALDTVDRSMTDLRSDHSRLIHALDAWYKDFSARRSTPSFAVRKDTIMSSLLLYQLSRLRLCAPLEDLHHISYRAAEERLVDAKILQKVKAWSKTPSAQAATYQAWETKCLIESELRKPPEERARFNILAFCSLHHSIVVLWTFAGADESSESDDSFRSRQGNITRHDIVPFLQSCPQLFHQISPLGGASFEVAANRLWKHRFPWNAHPTG